MQISEVMTLQTQPNFHQIGERDIWTNFYQKCLILYSKILLDVLHNITLTIFLPWQLIITICWWQNCFCFKLLSTFQEVSGLKMNKSKTEGMVGTSCKNTAKLLGIACSANSILVLEINIWYNYKIVNEIF